MTRLLDLGERVESLERRIADVRLVVAGYFKHASERGAKCEHGRFYYEDCISCYDEAIEAALDGEPQTETLAGRQFDALYVPARP